MAYMEQETMEFTWGMTVIAGIITAIVCLILALSGSWLAFGIVAAVYLAAICIPGILVPMWYTLMNKFEELHETKKSIRQAETKAKVEEIELRHQLEMDKIRLEQHRIQYELKQMLVEDGVPLPSSVDEQAAPRTPRKVRG